MHALTAGRARDLEDLVQTAAEQALRALPTFEHRARLSTWTYRICYLTMLKERRWYRRWLRRFTLAPDGELPDIAAPIGEDLAGEQGERACRLRASVERLSPKRRAVVVLHDLEGVAIDDIAVIVGANPLTVRSRLRDGRRDLARLLAGDEYFGDEACRPGGAA
jgi:RNA polymerase sigma-70 factor (ECF subfamily)